MYNDLFEKVNEQLGEEDYQKEVKINVHIKDLGAEEDSNVIGKTQLLTYSIEIEYRSWGIKDISVRPRRVAEFEVEILDGDDNVVKTLPVKIDFSTVDYDIEWESGGSYSPEDMEVHLTRDGKVEEVILSFNYISQK